MMNIYFGLGSNLGNRLQNLRDAVNRLASMGKITACSDVYASSAWGGVPQPDYLNACVKLETPEDIDPHELLATIKRFEHELGRVPSVRWGERKIDIDILMIDGVNIASDDLNIPHVSIPERLFVLMPLLEICPENGKTIREMIDALDGEARPVRVTVL